MLTSARWPHQRHQLSGHHHPGGGVQNLLAQHCMLVCDLQQFPECIIALPLKQQTPQSIVR